jgi:hypothetical protein
MTIRRSAAQRPDIDKPLIGAGSLIIPSEKPFNILSFKSGQEADARGESRPVGQDGAACHAEARGGGSAWSEFQLGYCFDNAAGVGLQAAVKLRLTVTEARQLAAAAPGSSADSERPLAQAPPPAAPASAAASTNLLFFIKDTNGLILKQENILAADLDKGPLGSTNTYDLVFDGRFEPERGYYLVVAGQTKVQATADQAARSSLEVSQCSLEIIWQTAAGPNAPAPLPRPAASQPAPSAQS